MNYSVKDRKFRLEDKTINPIINLQIKIKLVEAICSKKKRKCLQVKLKVILLLNSMHRPWM